MKKNKYTILGFVIATLLYLMGVFIEVSFNIKEWDDTPRDIIGFFMFGVIIVMAVIQALKEENEE